MSSLQTPLFLKIRREIDAKHQYNRLRYKETILNQIVENPDDEYKLLQELDRMNNKVPLVTFAVEPRTWQQAMQQLDEKIRELNMQLWSWEKTTTERISQKTHWITWQQAIKSFENDMCDMEKRLYKLGVSLISIQSALRPFSPTGEPCSWQKGYTRIRLRIMDFEDSLSRLPK